MIVDTHLHVVSPDRDRYPLAPVELPNGAWYLDAPHSAEEVAALQVAAGVRGGVLVQPVAGYGTDNRYALDSAAADPDRFDAVVVVDAWSEGGADDLSAAIDAGARGVRLFDIPPRHEPLLASAAARRVVARAVEGGIQVVVTVLPEGLASVVDLARSLEVPVTVEHCGFVELDTTDGRAALAALAGFGTVHLKVTSHVLQHVADTAGTVRWLADTFGADRLMWGSDFSQTHDRSYAELVDLGRRSAAGLDADEAAAYLGGTARRLWPRPAVAG